MQHGMKFVEMKIPCVFMVVTWLPVFFVRLYSSIQRRYTILPVG